MDAETKKVQKLVKTMRKLGISHYKTPEIELTLTPKAPKAKLSPTASEPIKPKTPAQLEEEQMKRLMWSSPGFAGGVNI